MGRTNSFVSMSCRSSWVRVGDGNGREREKGNRGVADERERRGRAKGGVRGGRLASGSARDLVSQYSRYAPRSSSLSAGPTAEERTLRQLPSILRSVRDHLDNPRRSCRRSTTAFLVLLPFPPAIPPPSL